MLDVLMILVMAVIILAYISYMVQKAAIQIVPMAKKALEALLALGSVVTVIKLVWDKVNPTDVLKGNTDVLKGIDSINREKQAIDDQLKTEEQKRADLDKAKGSLTNDQLADDFNNRK